MAHIVMAKTGKTPYVLAAPPLLPPVMLSESSLPSSRPSPPSCEAGAAGRMGFGESSPAAVSDVQRFPPGALHAVVADRRSSESGGSPLAAI